MRVDLIDRIIPVTDQDAVATAIKIMQEEGLSVGISSGAVAWAALQEAHSLKSRENDRHHFPLVLQSVIYKLFSLRILEANCDKADPFENGMLKLRFYVCHQQNVLFVLREACYNNEGITQSMYIGIERRSTK